MKHFAQSLLILLLAACGDHTGPETSRPTELLPASVSEANAIVGQIVEFVVEVKNDRGNVVAGVPVAWVVASPSDSILSADSITDALGRSAVRIRVGAIGGARAVTATISEVAPRTFSIIVPLDAVARIALTPTTIQLVARDTLRVSARVSDFNGSPVAARLKWAVVDGRIASIDSTGFLKATRAGSAMLYVSMVEPPFLVDSIRVNVTAAVAASLQITKEYNSIIVGDSIRLRGVAYDAAGRVVNAEDIVWELSNSAVRTGRIALPNNDTSVVNVSGNEITTATATARIGSIVASLPLQVIASPVIDSFSVANQFLRYGGFTFDPQGRWYYVRSAGDNEAVLRAGDPGREAWTSEQFESCPTGGLSGPWCRISADANGQLYIPTWQGILAIDANSGERRWFATFFHSRAAAVSATGRVFATGRNELAAINATTGQLLWRHFQPTVDIVQAAVDDARNVVYALGGGQLTALSVSDVREVLWQVTTGGTTAAPPVLGADGTIYVVSQDQLRAYWPDGSLRAIKTLGGNVAGSPVIGPDNNVYVVTFSGTFYGLTADLQEQWRYAYPRRGGTFVDVVMSSPAVDANGTVYAATVAMEPGQALNPGVATFGLIAVRDGRAEWAVSRIVTASEHLTFAPNGDLMVSARTKTYRVRTAGFTGLAWPMAHGGPQHRSAR